MDLVCYLCFDSVMLSCLIITALWSLSDNIQADVIDTLNSASIYLYNLLNIDNPYFDQNGKGDISHIFSV